MSVLRRVCEKFGKVWLVFLVIERRGEAGVDMAISYAFTAAAISASSATVTYDRLRVDRTDSRHW